ncbi:MAG: CDP-alcohol phosphatidyltransferase family protein [Stellaceae bacterium]
MDTYNFLRALPRPFGLANWVTLIRALVAIALLAEAALLLATGRPAAGIGLRWLAVAAASAALCLDWADGHLARRLGTATGFGARFDMETDAVQILALTALVWSFGQAGAWVLASGLMRYIFAISGCLWPVLALPLPRSKRRQAVCVAQAIALILALAPPIAPVWGSAICLAGLAFLSYSFGLDLAWLAGQARAKGEAVW